MPARESKAKTTQNSAKKKKLPKNKPTSRKKPAKNNRKVLGLLSINYTIVRKIFVVPVTCVCLVTLVIQFYVIKPPQRPDNAQLQAHTKQVLSSELDHLSQEISQLDTQKVSSENSEPFNEQALQKNVYDIRSALTLNQLDVAQILISNLENKLTNIRSGTSNPKIKKFLSSSYPGSGELLPILIYHKTPANFSAELDSISAHGYQTITMSMLSEHLTKNSPIPAKSIVITFDDGYENQLEAYRSLLAHHMRATFYIIVGSQNSNFCIGAFRTNHSCGDDYLTWNQIRMLDQSGMIEIGAHTIDHLPLGVISNENAKYQIEQSKREIEIQIGHSISTFAYPYGSFNEATPIIVKEAGFSSAVSTIAGYYQSVADLYSLRRIRSVDQLP